MSDKSYLAAPHRNHLSATAKAMLNHQLLNKGETHLDYGCGRGGDVEKLLAAGYCSAGYDPYYFPNPPSPVDVVTMGYVLNVIADIEERRESLRKAWNLAKKHLIVSANVRGGGLDAGNYTAQGTFSKSYSYIELKAFIECTLGFEAIKLASDKFLVKRDGRQFQPMHHEKILEEISAIASLGWVPPMDAIIKGYCNDFKPRAGLDEVDSGEFPGRIRYYRILAKSACLPGKNGPVRCLHIRGGVGSEHMEWAIAAMQRRNAIALMKFHCIEQSFLSEFLGFKKLDFLNDEVKIYR
ncbi:hypothetical protein I8748_20090 [Nostoc sp. CENA67]|uniref:DNA phosphorothioation-associated methyltransferase n=1 Tax=Amazonocrinis nigriterrae CENA67 TaxID=2794033 RepID=A0A8J7L8G5_9NOST|nr:hypothetical protein [Amazonocrinis nigriterrae]MBH8564454.1 hypothetical protein [Amazonocrinis nigriterrae CENA67]